MNFQPLLRNNYGRGREKKGTIRKASLALGLLGVLVFGLGVIGVRVWPHQESPIEILTQENEGKTEKTIFVDLAGAVQKPGVYELKSDSRINDLLVAAGGLSAEADRDWVARQMNLAQKLADGAKIYIPERSETSGGSLGTLGSLGNLGLININTALVNQLETLWGIGPATAEKIIAGRPYQSTEELYTKKIVKSNVWEAIKDKITVY